MTDSDAEHDACADFFADADSADADAADSPSYHPLEHLLTVSYLISSKRQHMMGHISSQKLQLDGALIGTF